MQQQDFNTSLRAHSTDIWSIRCTVCRETDSLSDVVTSSDQLEPCRIRANVFRSTRVRMILKSQTAYAEADHTGTQAKRSVIRGV